jgi:hypothetical protein
MLEETTSFIPTLLEPLQQLAQLLRNCKPGVILIRPPLNGQELTLFIHRQALEVGGMKIGMDPLQPLGRMMILPYELQQLGERVARLRIETGNGCPGAAREALWLR